MRRIAGTIGARLALSLFIVSAATAAAQAHAGASGLILLLPTELYILGGAAAVLASFVVLALFRKASSEPFISRTRSSSLRFWEASR